MKKILIFISIFIASIYLSSAVNIVLTSGTKLDNSSWNDLSGVLNKVDINSSDLNIDGKLGVTGKICDNSGCLGECDVGYSWDINTNSCILPATTKETAGISCLSVKQINTSAVDGIYWIDPNGGDKTDAFQVYCDMTNDGGGWTLVFKAASIYNFTSAEDNKTTLTDPYSKVNGKLSDSQIQGLTTIRWRVMGVDDTYRVNDNQSRYLDTSCKFGINNSCLTTCGNNSMNLDCQTGDGYPSTIRSYCCTSSFSRARILISPNDQTFIRNPKGISGLRFNANNSDDSILVWVK